MFIQRFAALVCIFSVPLRAMDQHKERFAHLEERQAARRAALAPEVQAAIVRIEQECFSGQAMVEIAQERKIEAAQGQEEAEKKEQAVQIESQQEAGVQRSQSTPKKRPFCAMRAQFVEKFILLCDQNPTMSTLERTLKDAENQDAFEAALRLFLQELAEELYQPSKDLVDEVTNTLKHNRFGRAGGWAYSFYHPRWHLNLSHAKRGNLMDMMPQMLQFAALNAQAKTQSGDNRAMIVQIAQALEQNARHQWRLVLLAENMHRNKVHIFVRTLFENPKRTLLLLTVCVVGAYSLYRHWSE